MDDGPDQDVEVNQLKSCISDLLAILALRPFWIGADGSRMATMLADVLAKTVDSDFLLVGLRQNETETLATAVRRSARWPDEEIVHDPRELLRSEEGGSALSGIRVQEILRGSETYRLAASGIGLQGELGFVVVGARRAGFPLSTERLIIQASINQALICLQENARLAEQQSRAAELDWLVTLRTAELAESNAKLLQQATEQQVLQERLAHANRMATIGQMTAVLSHELRQPLASVVASGHAAANWLGQSPANVEAARRSIERLIAEGVRAGNVLDRTKRLLQNAPPKRGRHHFNSVIEEAVQLAAARAESQAVKLRTDLDPAISEVLVDSIQLQQLVINLISNAVDAIGGAECATREVAIQTRLQSPDLVQVTVRDTGPGIPLELFDRLFDSFFTTKAEGMGLGLAICRDIVKAHDGTIWAENAPEGGAEIHFSLPTRL